MENRQKSSSDDYSDAEVIRWDLASERFLHNDRRLETQVMHQGDVKLNPHVKSMSASPEKVNDSLNHTLRHFCSVVMMEKVLTPATKMIVQVSSLMLNILLCHSEVSVGTRLQTLYGIYSTVQEGSNEENDPEDEDSFRPEVEQLKTEQVERDPLFFSCTICNVNFKEKIHFHRHMMYHLDKHNQLNSENVSLPFICRECGRLFCDSNSLMSHIIIHQDRLEKLVEQFKVLQNIESEDGQCPQFVFGCKTHKNLKRHFLCEGCNYIP